jgi:cytosine deaminase
MKDNLLLLKVGVESAYMQALKSFNEGGVPVGAALMIGESIASIGHNQRVQKKSNILHGEMDCLENAGHELNLKKSILFTTLSPCLMCSNAILLFGIPKVVILDNVNKEDFRDGEDFLRSEGVEIIIFPHKPSIELNRRFQKNKRTRKIWIGDIGS